MAETVDLGEALGYLETLASDLTSQGFITNITPHASYPTLSVVSRHTSQLKEEVCVAQAGDGLWMWWSWGERLAPVTDLAAAASKIAHVLSPAEPSPSDAA